MDILRRQAQKAKTNILNLPHSFDSIKYNGMRQNIFLSRKLFSLQIKKSVDKFKQQFSKEKTKQKMFYWCFNCSKITIPQSGIKCQFCLSQAIEEMKEQNSPAQFIPYSLPPQQTQPNNHNDHPNQMITLMRLIQPQTMSFFSISPTFSFVRIIRLDGDEQQGTSVDDQKYQQLQKIKSLDSECAVCQEKEGNGVKLGCKHEFHDECLKPWFKNANTCPCCRATV